MPTRRIPGSSLNNNSESGCVSLVFHLQQLVILLSRLAFVRFSTGPHRRLRGAEVAEAGRNLGCTNRDEEQPPTEHVYLTRIQQRLLTSNQQPMKLHHASHGMCESVRGARQQSCVGSSNKKTSQNGRKFFLCAPGPW